MKAATSLVRVLSYHDDHFVITHSKKTHSSSNSKNILAIFFGDEWVFLAFHLAVIWRVTHCRK